MTVTLCNNTRDTQTFHQGDLDPTMADDRYQSAENLNVVKTLIAHLTSSLRAAEGLANHPSKPLMMFISPAQVPFFRYLPIGIERWLPGVRCIGILAAMIFSTPATVH